MSLFGTVQAHPTGHVQSAARQPAPFRPRGSIRLRPQGHRRRVRVLLRPQALAAYMALARQFTYEIGFLCLGRRLRDGRRTVVVVAHIVLASHGTRAAVQIAAADKARIAAAWPDHQIVGWAHTHPGFGVFWSATDRENCADFGPLGVNLVCDPHSDQVGIALGCRFLSIGSARRLLARSRWEEP